MKIHRVSISLMKVSQIYLNTGVCILCKYQNF